MKQNRTDWFLPVKIWLLCMLIVAPLLLILVSSYVHEPIFRDWNDLKMVLLIVTFGVVFSIPTLLATYLVYFILVKQKLRFPWILGAVLLVALIGQNITIQIIDGGMANEMEWIYGMAILLSALPFSKRLFIKQEITQ